MGMYSTQDSYEIDKMSGHYSKKGDRDDRMHQGAIWLGLFILMFIFFVATAVSFVKEANLKRNGNSITTSYKSTDESVLITDKDGKSYTIPLGMFYKHDQSTITVYYYGDDIASAMPLSSLGWFVLNFTFWGGTAGISMWRFLKNFLRSKHYRGEHIEYTYKTDGSNPI